MSEELSDLDQITLDWWKKESLDSFMDYYEYLVWMERVYRGTALWNDLPRYYGILKIMKEVASEVNDFEEFRERYPALNQFNIEDFKRNRIGKKIVFFFDKKWTWMAQEYSKIEYLLNKENQKCLKDDKTTKVLVCNRRDLEDRYEADYRDSSAELTETLQMDDLPRIDESLDKFWNVLIEWDIVSYENQQYKIVKIQKWRYQDLVSLKHLVSRDITKANSYWLEKVENNDSQELLEEDVSSFDQDWNEILIGDGVYFPNSSLNHLQFQIIKIDVVERKSDILTLQNPHTYEVFKVTADSIKKIEENNELEETLDANMNTIKVDDYVSVSLEHFSWVVFQIKKIYTISLEDESTGVMLELHQKGQPTLQVDADICVLKMDVK